MKKAFKLIALMMCLVMLVCTFAACGEKKEQGGEQQGQTPSTYQFTMSGGASGGSMHMLFAAMANNMETAFPGSTITVMAGGLNSNPKMCSTGDIEFGITSTDIFPNALAGTKTYTEKQNIASVCRVNTDGVFYFMVKKSLGVSSIDEIIEKKIPIRIATFTKGQSPEVTLEEVLAAYGISYDDITSWGGSVEFSQWGDAVERCRDNQADCLAGVTTLPSSFHMQFAEYEDVVMLPVRQDIIEKLCGSEHYEPITIPGGTYKGCDEDVASFGFQYLVVTNPDVPEDTVYQLVKNTYEHIDDLKLVHNSFSTMTKESLAEDLPSPIHPGALKFFKEVGLIK